MKRFLSLLLPCMIVWASMGECCMCFLLSGPACPRKAKVAKCSIEETRSCKFECDGEKHPAPAKEERCEHVSTASRSCHANIRPGTACPCRCAPRPDRFTTTTGIKPEGTPKLASNMADRSSRFDIPQVNHEAPDQSRHIGVHPSVCTMVLRC